VIISFQSRTPPNGLAHRQQRDGQDAFVIILHFLPTECVPSAAKPLSGGAGVRRQLLWVAANEAVILPDRLSIDEHMSWETAQDHFFSLLGMCILIVIFHPMDIPFIYC
jgi:hypothetical protein